MVRELCLRPQIAKVWAVVSLSVGRAGSPCNIMWPGPRPTFVPSGVLIHANQPCLDLCGVFHAARKQVSAALCTSPQNHSRLGRFCMLLRNAVKSCGVLHTRTCPRMYASICTTLLRIPWPLLRIDAIPPGPHFGPHVVKINFKDSSGHFSASLSTISPIEGRHRKTAKSEGERK